MTEDQLSRVRKLIRKMCCNYDDGNCLLFDWPECSICPQWITYSLLCKWFRYAVLPNDKALEADIYEGHQKRSKRRCAMCGGPLESEHAHTKYCPDCRKNRVRKQKAEWARRNRLRQ